MDKRIEWVDVAKGIGIILVVYGHVLRGINTAQMNVPQNFFYNSDRLLYGFHMPLFFFLSGLFVEKWFYKKNRIKEKIKVIVYPYIIWSLLQGGINILFSSVTNNPMSLKELLANIAYNPYGQFWFLYVLFIHYVLYLVLRKNFQLTQVLLMALFLAILSPLIKVWIFESIFFHFLFFVLGAFLNNQLSLKCINNGVLFFSIGLFIITGFSYLTIPLSGYLEFLGKTVFSFCGIFAIFSLSNFLLRFKISSFIKYIGYMSLVIYLAHTIAASGFRILVSHLLGTNNYCIHIFLGMIAGIFLPIIGYRLLEYLKIEKYFFGRSLSRGS
ncbi:acyltransferase family protein [Dehalobacter sp. TBBPA1]|uniref:acyltransferase family protein n=1 Tax=Dehalobacter sp. TBBPA1 TaxID=3235037 RepID=UPI0034A23C55